jgi:hypothetical protein
MRYQLTFKKNNFKKIIIASNYGIEDGILTFYVEFGEADNYTELNIYSVSFSDIKEVEIMENELTEPEN